MRLQWRLLAVVLLAGVLAYFLRDVIDKSIIQPIFYLLWILKLYYEAFPQAFLWVALIVGITLMETASLVVDPIFRGKREPARKPVQGPVELLAEWMTRAPKGLYFKWLIAQRLGNLSRRLIAFRSRQPVGAMWEPLRGPGWEPPREVAAYLESGLSGSFADFPRPRWPFQKPEQTPLDIDPARAIDYIESQMKDS